METRRLTAVRTSRQIAFQLCLYPLLAVALVAGWQATTVHVNYRGNWTALFCIGSRFPVPPELTDEHVYVFPDSPGFDGQFYHLIAHDPLFRMGFGRYIDAPEFRYRRILVPALAFVFAAGQPRWIDAAYVLVRWLFVGFGTSAPARDPRLDSIRRTHYAGMHAASPSSSRPVAQVSDGCRMSRRILRTNPDSRCGWECEAAQQFGHDEHTMNALLTGGLSAPYISGIVSNWPPIRTIRPEKFGLDSLQWRRLRSIDFGFAPGGVRLSGWSADTWQAS